MYILVTRSFFYHVGDLCYVGVISSVCTAPPDPTMHARDSTSHQQREIRAKVFKTSLLGESMALLLLVHVSLSV